MSTNTKLKFQVILFGDFSSVDATSENVSILMPVMTPYQMLPNTFKEIEIQSNGQQLKNDRIAFSNMKNGLNITFGIKRIDITNHIVGLDDKNMYTINDFIDVSKKIIKNIISVFPSTESYNRLSFISDYFTNKNDEEKQKIYDNLIHNISDCYPLDWSLKQNNTLRIESLKQDINHVSIIERVQGKFVLDEKEKEIDDIKIQLDINTKPEIVNKFKNQDVDLFLDESLKLYENYNKKIEEVFNGTD